MDYMGRNLGTFNSKPDQQYIGEFIPIVYDSRSWVKVIFEIMYAEYQYQKYFIKFWAYSKYAPPSKIIYTE
ncbi:MAG: hypothetical protein FJY07_00830 [Bacteroidetes bacterium]|nr:hypothetical protein [Bacteroidota bacterium]